MSNSNDLAESDTVLLLKQPLQMNTDESVKLEVVTSTSDILDILEQTVPINESKPELGTPYPVSTPYISNSPPPETVDLSQNAKIAAEATNTAQVTTDAAAIKLQLYNQMKTLPWRPKVRLRELELFLDQERKKFLGFGDLTDDLDTLIGLPYPIHESIRILKQHLYVSLSDEQIKLEEKIIKYPMSTKVNEEEVEESPAELLFNNVLSNLPQYLVSFKLV